MKRILLCLGLLWSALANAQFTPGQILTAAELNSQFALYAPLTGATFSGPLITGSLTVTGTANLPPIALTGLSAQAANTVVANATGSSASPTAFAMPSCSTSSSALNWATSTGFTCNTAVNASTLGGATFASPGPIGSTTPSTGAFTTLTASTPLTVANGGTGLSTLTAFNVLIGNGTGNVAFVAPGAAGIPLTSRGAGSNPAFQGITVAGGGTGLTTITAHAVMVGEGTGNISPVGPGTTGQMLIGSTGADPAFGNTVSTLTATGTITPSSTNGIVGTTTNDNANAGSVGEYITNTTSATSVSSGVTLNSTSASLTAGDWDVECVNRFNPAATTVPQSIQTGVSSTSATFGTFGTAQFLAVTLNTGVAAIQASPVVRFSLAATTTVFCLAFTNFTTSTMTVDGFLRARRVR